MRKLRALTKYANWKLIEREFGIAISADVPGGVNPTLNIQIDKQTGAVSVTGTPDLTAIGCNGKVHSCRLSMFECYIESQQATKFAETVLD